MYPFQKTSWFAMLTVPHVIFAAMLKNGVSLDGISGVLSSDHPSHYPLFSHIALNEYVGLQAHTSSDVVTNTYADQPFTLDISCNGVGKTSYHVSQKDGLQGLGFIR